MPEIAYFIVVLFFAIYGVLCGIECGVALVRLFPALSGDTQKSQYLFTPVWEITNVFFGVWLYGI